MVYDIIQEIMSFLFWSPKGWFGNTKGGGGRFNQVLGRAVRNKKIMQDICELIKNKKVSSKSCFKLLV